MTAPADPREALPCGFVYKESTRMICGQPEQAWPHYPGASGHHAYKPNERRVGKPDRRALAARQDEPSPALRDLFDSIHPWRVALEGIARHSGDPGSRFVAEQALAANPPQTREAEGADLREMLRETLAALTDIFPLIPTGDDWRESVQNTMNAARLALAGNHEVCLDPTGQRVFASWERCPVHHGPLAARTPEAQRDAEPPDLDALVAEARAKVKSAIGAAKSERPSDRVLVRWLEDIRGTLDGVESRHRAAATQPPAAEPGPVKP